MTAFEPRPSTLTRNVKRRTFFVVVITIRDCREMKGLELEALRGERRGNCQRNLVQETKRMGGYASERVVEFIVLSQELEHN